MVVGDDHQCRSLLRLNRIEWMQTRGLKIASWATSLSTCLPVLSTEASSSRCCPPRTDLLLQPSPDSDLIVVG